MLCFCGGYVVRQASLAPLLGAFANGLRGRRTKGKRKGIRARDHAPKSSLPFPLLTPATQAISQTTLLASLRCRVTTPKLYLGVLDGTGSRGCLDFELANSLEETLSCFDAIWAGCFVNGRVRTPADHPSGRTHTWEGRIIRLHCRNDALTVFSCTKSECVGRCLMFF